MQGKSLLVAAKNVFQSFALRILHPFVRRKDNYVAIGSWCGERYADNSRYLAEYIYSKRKDLKLFWVGVNDIRVEVLQNMPMAEFLEIGTFRTNVKLLRCKYMFFSQMHSADISPASVYSGAITCYLHHGMPIKKWAQDGLNQKTVDERWIYKIVAALTQSSLKYNYFVVSCELHGRTNCTALAYRGARENNNLNTGTPRNDILVNYDPVVGSKLKSAYAAQLGFESNKRVILYAPTFRRLSKDVFSFTKLTYGQQVKLESFLAASNAVLIEKSHMAEKAHFDDSPAENIIIADRKLNIQEMLLFTDCLISDYSGVFLDYILLNRPVVHFAYDYEFYKDEDSGLYYDIVDFSAGPVVTDYDTLLIAIDNILSGNDDYGEKRAYVRNKYMTYECGRASEKIVERVIGN